MQNTILKASNISKQYRLGLVGTGTLSHDLNRWWHKLRGQPDPYLKVGAVNDRSQSAKGDYVWALQDINFEVKQGEVLGIIGKNGAGKSTLLKLLSRVTLPTTGVIKTKGRIASLLEVGTGFHPELTGRENIFLNGAILGMTKAEIKSKEEEIIAFSGCEMYIDTPVKRYSSGMRVRLAFAVAAHLEPDILVIDEVLAVGDAEFQKKALGKMKDISGTGGRTVLFVSHNMAAVKSLCTRGIVLEHGKVAFEGGTDESVDFYLKKNNFLKKHIFKPSKSQYIKSFKIKNINENNIFTLGDTIIFNFELFAEELILNNDNKIVIAIYNSKDEKICKLSTEYALLDRNNYDNKLSCVLRKLPLIAGEYYTNLAIYQNNSIVETYEKCLIFSVLDGDFYKVNKLIGKAPFKFTINQNWS